MFGSFSEKNSAVRAQWHEDGGPPHRTAGAWSGNDIGQPPGAPLAVFESLGF